MRQQSTKRVISVLLIFLIFHIHHLCNPSLSLAGEQNKSNSQSGTGGFQTKNLSQGSTFTPGDGLTIDTFPDTASILAQPFPIDFNGMVDFPMIGKVKVTEMNTDQLEQFLKTQFSSYLRYPNLKVKPAIRISLLGGVVRPGLYYIDQNNSLWEVVRVAGGTTFETGLKDMIWERSRDEVVDDLIPFFEKGISLKEMGFKSGDQLWTPSSQIPPSMQTFQTLLPLITLITTVVFFYLTYQQNMYLAQTRR